MMIKKIFLALCLSLCAIMQVVAQDIYLRGRFNGWAAQDSYKFQKEGDTRKWTFSVNLTSDFGQFKIADSNWSEIDLGAVNNGDRIMPDTKTELKKKGANMEMASGLSSGTYVMTVVEDAEGTWWLYVSNTGGTINPETNKADGTSGTLPVLYINTSTKQSNISKNEYAEGTYYLDNRDVEGYESIGTKEEPLPLQIKGRGNWTWSGFDKKPYRIKLQDKQKLMGMKKSKHWALMAIADDAYCGLKNTIGYELSKLLGMPWTPDQEPIEVIWNGEYQGLYMLTETVRIDKKRIDIHEQSDNISYPDSITGGWLVEIDNYKSDSDPYIALPYYGDGHEWVTIHSPEVLSSAQRSYIEDQILNKIEQNVMAKDKSSDEWEKYIDKDQLARFYVCQEIMDDGESFHGSCYLYKDMGDEEKWKFGPVWDFGNSFRHKGNGGFIYENPPFGQRWIGDLAKFPAFQTKVKEVWKQWKGNATETLYASIDDFCEQISKAAEFDAKKWPQYGHSDVEQ